MLRLRTMPKHCGTIIILGILIPTILTTTAIMYVNNHMDSGWIQGNVDYIKGFNFLYKTSSTEDYTRIAIGDDSSYAYKKMSELDMIDEEEDVQALPNEDEAIKPFQTISYKESLKRTADEGGKVLVKFCEEGQMDSAVNFHETAIVKAEIYNVLYVTPDITVCQEFWKLEVKCHVMEDDFFVYNNSKKIEMRHNMLQKRAVARIKLILQAITAGFTVLFTDSTTLYMKNPFDSIKCDDNCDAAISVDNISINYANWAIHLAKPRRSTVYMYARLLTVLGSHHVVSSKDILNNILKSLSLKKEISIAFLDAEKFAPASYFFAARRFASEKSQCRSCVAVFEDRGVSHQDEVYQLKESHMWNANFDEYYTSRRRMYIVFENVWEFSERKSLIHELTALRNALAIGQVLKRIVVLPKFHCPQSVFEMKFCGLGDLIKMSSFDEQFDGLYRENTFMQHPKVSREVRRTVTDPHFIGKKLPEEDWDGDAEIKPRKKLIFLDPMHPKGFTDEELADMFRTEPSYNLWFHSLYDGFVGFEDKKDADDFNKKIRNGFRLTTPIKNIVEERSFEIF